MTEEDIYRQLTSIFHETFDDDSILLTPALSADDIEEWDSLSNIRLVVATEQHFGFRFTTSEVSAFQNVGEFVASILEKSNP